MLNERLSNKQSNLLFSLGLGDFGTELLVDKLLYISSVCESFNYRDLFKAMITSNNIHGFLDLADVILKRAISENKEVALCNETLEISTSSRIGFSVSEKAESAIMEYISSVDPVSVPSYLIYRFEWWLSNNQMAGQYFTPSSITNLVVNLMNIKDGDSIADFCSGTGAFLSKACDFSNSNGFRNNSYFGCDVSYEATSLAKINLLLRTRNAQLQQADVLSLNDRKFDKVFSEFPLAGIYNKTTKELGCDTWTPIHVDRVSRSSFSWVYMAKAINSLKEGGVAVCVAPLGALFSTYESNIRKQVVEGHYLDTIISLPRLHVPYTGVSTCILIFKKHNENGVLFIDATKMGVEERRRCSLSENDISQISSIYLNKIDTEISKFVSIKDIAETDYTLLPERYIFKATKESFKIPNPKPLDAVKESIVKSYISDSKKLTSDPTSNIRVVKSSDIEDGSFDIESLSYLAEVPENIEKFLLKDGDIVLTNKSTKIKTAIVKLEKNEKLVMFGSLYGIRVNTKLANPYYIQCYLNSNVGNLKLAQMQTGTIIQCITQANLLQLEVPCPSLEEQNSVAKEYLLKLEMLEDTKQRVSKLSKDITEMFSDLVED